MRNTMHYFLSLFLPLIICSTLVAAHQEEQDKKKYSFVFDDKINLENEIDIR